MNLCFCPFRACLIAAPFPGCYPGLCAFALAGRVSSLRYPQGVALGYVLLPLQGEALNTEARSHGEYIFKFSEDTEILKTPWLCVFIYSISNLWRAVLHKVKTLRQ